MPVNVVTILISLLLIYFSDLTAQETGIERDPFVSILDIEKQRILGRELSLQRKKKELANISLKGIIWSNLRSVAIINDKPVMPGDEIDGYKITQIDKESVTLNYNRATYTVFIDEFQLDNDKLALKENPQELPPPIVHPEGMLQPGYPQDNPMSVPETEVYPSSEEYNK